MNWSKGQRIDDGRYEIIDRVGVGEFGHIYKAIDLKSVSFWDDGIVLIKTIDEQHQYQTNFDRFQEAFTNDAVVAGYMSPYLAKVGRLFGEDKIWAIIEDINRKNLENYIIYEGKLSPNQAVEIIQQIGGAVNYVGSQLLHRNIKPANIKFTGAQCSNIVVLNDIGLRAFIAELSHRTTVDWIDRSALERTNHYGDFQYIHDLATTLYACITGNLTPSPDIQIIRNSLLSFQQLNSPLRNSINQAILIGLSLKPEDILSKEDTLPKITLEEWLNLMPLLLFKPNKEYILSKFRCGQRTFNLIDFSDLQLQKVHLPKIVFVKVNCNRINFQGAYLNEGKFESTDLHSAVLKNVSLNKASFNHSNLQNANLRGADLSDATFEDTNLQGANFCGAHLKGAKISEEQLKQTKTNFLTIFPNGKRGGSW
jgi:serine/threonine protein kinase